MQQRNYIKLAPFQNFYCEVLPCALSEFYICSPNDEKLLSDDEVKTLCEYVIEKNLLAGGKEVFLKIPRYVCVEDLFEKYNINGKIILPALEICSLPVKALVGDKLLFEIESFSDLSDGFLTDLANFVGDKSISMLINLGDDLTEVGKVVNRFKMTPTQLCESYGFLDRKCYVRGLNHVDKDDLAILTNYDVMAILTPRDDASQGKGFINNYNLIYNCFPFGFGSGKCYNIDMLAEGRLSCQNTSNLLSQGGLIKCDDILKALSCGDKVIEIEFDCDAREETILEKHICLGKSNLVIQDKVKQIMKKLKEKK